MFFKDAFVKMKGNVLEGSRWLIRYAKVKERTAVQELFG